MSIFFLIEFVLSLFQKRPENVVALIGDTCATSKAFLRYFDCGFVNCAFHRFNLAVKEPLLNKKLLLSQLMQ